MSAQHSAGPWRIDEMDTRKRQYRIRCEVGRSNGGAGMVVAERIELDHDARLIAAAPELLSALEDALAALDMEGVCTATCAACDAARAAIAKATGAQS